MSGIGNRWADFLGRMTQDYYQQSRGVPDGLPAPYEWLPGPIVIAGCVKGHVSPDDETFEITDVCVIQGGNLADSGPVTVHNPFHFDICHGLVWAMWNQSGREPDCGCDCSDSWDSSGDDSAESGNAGSNSGSNSGSDEEQPPGRWEAFVAEASDDSSCESCCQSSLSESSMSSCSCEESSSNQSSEPESSSLVDVSCSGSSKSTAIVPASWTPGGFCKTYADESTMVRFNDIIEADISDAEGYIQIDPHFMELCVPRTFRVCGWSADQPVLVGISVDCDRIHVRLGAKPDVPVHLVMEVKATRRGFAGVRLEGATFADFKANEAFWKGCRP